MAVRSSSSADFFHVEMVGSRNVVANLDGFVDKVRRKLLRNALKETGEPIQDAMQSGILNSRTGALRSSIDMRIEVNAGGTIARLYVGPRRGIKIPVRVVQTGKYAGQVLVAIPTRYAHLIEYGHKIVNKKGETVGYVSPIPFGRNAWAVAGGERALDNFANALEKGIEAETFDVNKS